MTPGLIVGCAVFIGGVVLAVASMRAPAAPPPPCEHCVAEPRRSGSPFCGNCERDLLMHNAQYWADRFAAGGPL